MSDGAADHDAQLAAEQEQARLEKERLDEERLDEARLDEDRRDPEMIDEEARAAQLPPPRKRRPRGRSWGAFLVILLILVIGGGVSAPYWAPPLGITLPWSWPRTGWLADRGQEDQETTEGPAPEEGFRSQSRLDAVEQRLASLEQGRQAETAPGDGSVAALADRIAALEQHVGNQSGADQANGSDAKALRAELDRQQAAIGDLDNRLGTLGRQADERGAANGAAIEELRATLSRLNEAQSNLAGRLDKLAAAEEEGGRVDQALSLALGQLRQAMSQSAPFTAAFENTLALAKKRPEIAAALALLGEPAQHGLPSVAVLRQRFEDVAGAVATAGEEQPSQSWSEAILDRLRGFVTVRHVGRASGATAPESAVATAESALADGDLAGAVAALQSLHGPAADKAQGWTDMAQQRLAAEAALAQAEQRLAARLQIAPGTPSETDAAPAPGSTPNASTPSANTGSSQESGSEGAR